MFIELTDHLRCPAEHDEAYLVLLPEQMDGRLVREGSLGCPVCGAVVRVAEGVATFDATLPSTGDTTLTAEAIAALLGLGGPRGTWRSLALRRAPSRPSAPSWRACISWR